MTDQFILNKKIFNSSIYNGTIIVSFTNKYCVLELLGQRLLIKLKNKNRGNAHLTKAIDDLIEVIEKASWNTQTDIVDKRPDADCVHSDGFYFFNIHIHRTMIMVEFEEDMATVVWVGAHNEYDRLFKGNKKTIEKWLRCNGLIE